MKPPPDVVVLSLQGEIDLATSAQIKEAATAASDNCRCLVFDLTRVSFMDSAGLHLLVDMDRTMKAGGGAVKVVNAHTGI
jgi:anti-anti-sigma factor